jgi:cytoskeleton protein RodZ
MAFGKELQLERERRKISLASIAEGTKVPEKHLLALEQEEFEQLPGGVFSRGIVRSYCRYVGLNEDEWLQRFPAAPEIDDTQAFAEFASNVKRNRIRTNPHMHMRWWGVLLMLGAVGALSWVTWKYVVKTQVSGSSASIPFKS